MSTAQLSSNSTNVTIAPRDVSGLCFTVKCHFTHAETVLIVLATFLIFVISLVGNSTVCYIIAKSRKLAKSCTNFSILNLSIADLFLTLFSIPLQTVDMYIVDNWIYGLFMCRFATFLQNTAMVATILILLTISIEKFLVVCFPFQSRVYRNSFRYVLYFMWVVAIVDSASMSTFKVLIKIGASTRCIYQWRSRDFKRSYLMGHSTAFFFVPLVLMTGLHCATIIAIQKKTIHRANGSKTAIRMNSRQMRRRRKAVTILVLIVLLFTISWGPLLAVALWDAYKDPKDHINFELLNQVFVVCLFMVYISTAVHPVIYCFLGKEYRRAMKQSLWKKSNSSNTRLTPREQAAIPLRNLDCT